VVVFALAYLVIVGVISVVPQVFWPTRAEIDPSVGCAEGVRELQDELLTFAGDHVAKGGSAEGGTVRDFLASWDLRYRGLEDRCAGDERRAWKLLGRMRERLQGTLERFDEEEGALARTIHSTIESSP